MLWNHQFHFGYVCGVYNSRYNSAANVITVTGSADVCLRPNDSVSKIYFCLIILIRKFIIYIIIIVHPLSKINFSVGYINSTTTNRFLTLIMGSLIPKESR